MTIESHSARGLADEALDNLVHQFARPLDFLRELVQNSIDAGTPRIEVRVRYTPAKAGDTEPGVVAIHVDDWGEGMDEAIIDSQLTRMFSSTKEDDLTKIGKFGIGFTSIFAIQPDAVLLRTGRHGENWELIFHRDRSYDKVRIDTPVDGTKITLLKHMAADRVPAFCAEARWVLSYWCEHSSVPVIFWDNTEAEEAAAPDMADPFAAFEDPVTAVGPGPEAVSRPLSVDTELFVHHIEDAVEVVCGVTDTPGYGFYNGGLTLVHTTERASLEDWARRLGHLTFKVKYDRLEHTLTRDNVLCDEHWEKAMQVVARAADLLRARLIDHIAVVVEQGEDPGPWHARLAEELVAAGLHGDRPAYSDRVMLVDRRGKALSLAEVEAQEDAQGHVLMACGSGPLAEHLEASGTRLLPEHPGTRALLMETWSSGVLGRNRRMLTPADQLYLLPRLLMRADLRSSERAMMVAAEQLVEHRIGRRLKLRVGEFARGAREALVVNGPEDGGLFQRPGPTRIRMVAKLQQRCLLVNRQHQTYQAHATAARDNPLLAALGLLHALLIEEGLESPSTLAELSNDAARRLTGDHP
ncbi:MAG: hypothetical protein CL927_00205 [Deltaproteobacteria bacterium]|nr:hypothetical protein [Deltaproteobacteria bacterium]HCH64529.1 hypothetical protein [Deltaproteobacteria bacterium]